MGINTKPAVIKGVKKPPKPPNLYVGRLIHNITASELEEHCVEKNVELLHIRQMSISESHLKGFQCVFKFDEEKFELHGIWPENVTVSRFYLNEAARDWLKKVDLCSQLASPPLKQRSTKQRSTELNICLHNVRSVRSKIKDVNFFSEVNEISLGVFIELWITNNSDDDFILKQCCIPGFLFYSAPRVNKSGGGICVFHRYDLHLENFEMFTSEFFECCYVFLLLGLPVI